MTPSATDAFRDRRNEDGDAVVSHLTDLTGMALPATPAASSEHLGGSR